MSELQGITLMEDARFACQGSGACCQGYVVGPVSDAIAEAIDAHEFQANRALLAAGGFVMREVNGTRLRSLRQVDARCVFLGPDERCVIHLEMGAAAKPAMCRSYPFNFVIAPDGVGYISLNGECAGFHKGCEGPLLSEQIDDILGPALGLPQPVIREPIALGGGATESWDDYLDREERWLEASETADPLGFYQACLTELGADAPPLLSRLRPWIEAARKNEFEAGNLVDAELYAQVQRALDEVPVASLPPGGVHLVRTQIRNVIFGKGLFRAPDVAAGLALEALKLHLGLAVAATLGSEAEHVNEGLRTVNRCIRQSDLAELMA